MTIITISALRTLMNSLPHDHPASIHVSGLLAVACDARMNFACEVDDKSEYVELARTLDQLIMRRTAQ